MRHRSIGVKERRQEEKKQVETKMIPRGKLSGCQHLSRYQDIGISGYLAIRPPASETSRLGTSWRLDLGGSNKKKWIVGNQGPRPSLGRQGGRTGTPRAEIDVFIGYS